MAASYYVRQARHFPIEGCWVQEEWDESGLAVVVIARRQPNGNIVFGVYLVDYYCLGVKDTFCRTDISEELFQHDFMPKTYRDHAPISISPALAHEIVYGGIEYAAQFGFRPQRDFKLSQYILDPPGMHPRSGTVKFGKEGKPCYISGPHDDVQAIMNQLMRTAGEGNFDYLAHVGQPPDGWFDADDDDDE
jgi:hypothetical protein